MESILQQIVAHKKVEVAERRKRVPLSELEPGGPNNGERRFATHLSDVAATGPAIIAEIKRGSPSLGNRRKDMVAHDQAQCYRDGGAAALSVLTDEHFFYAKAHDFQSIRDSVSLPLLRKEFIIDEYQLYESRAMGADCILLILAILTDDQFERFATLAHQLGMDVLAETHTKSELMRAADIGHYDLVGINNRNLRTFETSLDNVINLAQFAPQPGAVVAESGIGSSADIRRLWRHGIRRYLIGEALITSEQPQSTMQQLIHAVEAD